MARLVLTTTDGFTFEIRPNEMETLEMTATPVMDPSGMEVLYHKILLNVRAVINPLMLATNQPTVSPAVIAPAGALPPAGLTYATGPGDRAGLTARAITQYMGNSRPLVQYWIGPDLTLEAPARLDAGGTSYPPCDPMGGPFVRHCRCYEIRGDKTIFLNLSIELATTAYSKIMLTNRWKMVADIDSAGFTTRLIDGVVKFRLDGLAQLGAFPDDFRNLLLVPADSSLRRVHSSFTAEDDQQTYRYHVRDRETAYGTGAASGIEKISGTVTIHSGTEVLTFKKARHQQLDALQIAANNGISGAAGTAMWGANFVLRNTLNLTNADCRISCAIRVTGLSGASKLNLYNTAMQVYAIKVRAPQVASGFSFGLESMTATQWIGSEDQPIVEIRAVLVATAQIGLMQLYSAAFASSLMNMDTGIGGALAYATVSPRTQLPNSNNTRGNGYTNNIFAQFLTVDSSQLPPAPIAPPIAMDVITEV